MSKPAAPSTFDDPRRLTRAAGLIAAATLISRLLGYVRDGAIAWYFGAGTSADVFFAAFRIPNLTRRLLVEGALNNAFIPIFTDIRQTEGTDAALRFGRCMFRMVVVAGLFLVVAGWWLAPLLVRWLVAPGFAENSAKLALTFSLLRMMLPYLFFVGLVAVAAGILNGLGHFGAPAMAQAVLNIVVIAALFGIVPMVSPPVKGLAFGVVLGGLCQWMVQWPCLVSCGIRRVRSRAWLHPQMKSVLGMLTATIMSTAVYQINLVTGTLLASWLPEGHISCLYYAERLVQFPLGLFAVAGATALLPTLSRLASVGNRSALNQRLSDALRVVFFAILPAAVGLMVLRRPIVALLFERGAFGPSASHLTANALLYYALGLWAVAAVPIIHAALFALKKSRIPVLAALAAIAVNLMLGLVLREWMQSGGIALAGSLAAMFHCALLLGLLKRSGISLVWASVGKSLLQSAMCALAMGAIVYGATVWMPFDAGDGAGWRAGCLTVYLACGVAGYALITFTLRNREALALLNLLRKD